MDAVRQHPALVVVRTQTELALLVRVHRTVPHSKASVDHHVPIARKGPLETLPTHLVLPLDDSLGGQYVENTFNILKLTIGCPAFNKSWFIAID